MASKGAVERIHQPACYSQENASSVLLCSAPLTVTSTQPQIAFTVDHRVCLQIFYIYLFFFAKLYRVVILCLVGHQPPQSTPASPSCLRDVCCWCEADLSASLGYNALFYCLSRCAHKPNGCRFLYVSLRRIKRGHQEHLLQILRLMELI